ncbi:MAG: hypothetical protein M3169_14525 [Candidatus Eremiobacteraeota bacterium]|nr:hypothetical protein [Candidatus Eremiobacteraeota bacterium]
MIIVMMFGLAAIPVAAVADEDDAALSPCSDFLQTADPEDPDSPCTVEARRVLAQLTLERSRDADVTTLQFPRAVIRYGASRSVEVRLGVPSVVRRFGDDVENHSADLLVGLKASSSRGRGVAGLALDTTVPTGDLGARLPTWRATLSGAYAVDKRVNIVGAIAAFRGANEDDPTAGRRIVLAPALGVEFEPIDGTELELGITRENTVAGTAHEVEVSVQHRIGRSIALRFGALRRLTPAGRSSTIGVGLNALL